MKEKLRQHQHRLYLCVLSIILVAMHAKGLVSGEIPFDARVTYLPLAQEFLESGFAVFSNPETVHVAPGSFLYMALAGAEAEKVRVLNLALAIASIFMVYGVVEGVAGRLAAVIAALLYTLNPLLQSVLLEPLSEPPFVFFTLLWLWGLVKACSAVRPWPWMLVSIAGLSCSVLTRGILFYWLYVAIVACLLVLLVIRSSNMRRQAVRILIIHVISLLPVWGYIAHNNSQHQVPMIATGSGAALYFGNNPATKGYEPPYFGLYHDEWLVIEPGSHLTPENDRRLKFAAIELIKELGAGPFLRQTLNKLAANAFFSRTGLDEQIYLHRAIRLALFAFAGCAFFVVPWSLLHVMLMGLLAYSTAILSPIMYNARYSIGAVELPLLLMAAIGLAGLLNRGLRLRLGLLLLTALCVIAGMVHAKRTSVLFLDLDNPLLRLRQFAVAQPEQLYTQGVELAGQIIRTSTADAQHRQIVWQVPPFTSLGGSTILSASFRQLDKSCRNLVVYYNDTASLRRKRLPTGTDVRFDIGVALLGLGTEGGTLRLDFKCGAGAAVILESLGISAIQYGLAYRERYELGAAGNIDASMNSLPAAE